jgi:hypothetical protein
VLDKQLFTGKGFADMAVDANIVAIFGPPPEGLDLGHNVILLYNVVTCVVLGVAVAVVGLRFYVRNMKSANIEMDDWAVLLSLVSETLSGDGVYTDYV